MGKQGTEESRTVQEYFKRTMIAEDVDMTNHCIGLTGVGDRLLEELFTMPFGLDPALEKAIEDFGEQKAAKEKKMKELKEKAALGGVRGMTAKNELAQLEASDATEMNRLEVTLAAAQKKAAKTNADEVLRARQKQAEDEEKAKKEAGRAKMAALASRFGGQ
eukprot:TRINITY_DN870_c0_g1_i12.p1 TRINITY_DN870_c0_g1~~TRINITY_DN870_c0_g1_i12.p1  ORF type:complete len:162 (+),score=47.26 TRINITY_DN870_c0_g1_i12:669-1154(+)